MNLFEYYASKIFLSICGWFFSLAPVNKRKVVFASARDNKASGNLLALSDAYKKAYPDATYVMLFRTYSYGLVGKVSYLFSLISTTYHLKTARYFFIDNALFPVHVIRHRKETLVIQVWHATGVLKRFGLDTDVDERKVENRFLHKGYDFVIADSEPTRNAYASAFHIPKQQVLGLGSARTDALVKADAKKKARAELEEKFPHLKNKTILLYAPTFRGYSASKMPASTLDAAKLKQQIGSSFALLYKPHAVIKNDNVSAFDCVLDSKDDINAYLPGFDGVITDYSSVLFETALVGLPLFKLCGDLQDYLRTNGFYLDYLKEIPGANCSTTTELGDAILKREVPFALNENEQNAYQTFCSKYCTYSDGNVTQRFLERFPL